MDKVTISIFILVLFGTLGAPIGGLYIWFVNSIAISYLDFDIIRSSKPSLNLFSIVDAVDKTTKVPFSLSGLHTALESAYAFGFVPSLLTGIYLAQTVVKKNAGHLRFGYLIGVASVCGIFSIISITPFNRVANISFMLNACIAAIVSFTVLYCVVKILLSNTPYQINRTYS